MNKSERVRKLGELGKLGKLDKLRVALICVLLLCLTFSLSHFLTFPVYAGAPQKINYQGNLTDSAGAPIDGTVSMEFKIFNGGTGDDELWSSGSVEVLVTNGLFNYILEPDTVDWEKQIPLI